MASNAQKHIKSVEDLLKYYAAKDKKISNLFFYKNKNLLLKKYP